MTDLICSIDQGKLRGLKDTDLDGTPFLSFQGIPYAKPPVGKLRFKDPQPPEAWEGIRDATKDGNISLGPKSPAMSSFAAPVEESEDCLFLNVFTRELYKNNNELKPVMVYIHGGAFVVGSGSRFMAGPEFLITEDIVLVSINYRLGALGFLKIDDPALGVTGNAGLKDTVAALKWVQNNIKNFGGDSNNVTIFGVSAGGAAVHFLILSPLATGLFHKAIIQSASVFNPWVWGDNSAQQLAQNLGFTGNGSNEILEFLQKVPADKLIEEQAKFGDWLTNHAKRFVGVTVEENSDTAFLGDDPQKLIETGNYNQVPIIFGYTSLEGLIEEVNQLMQSFSSNLEDFVPYYFGLAKNTKNFEKINQEICTFYFGDEKPDLDKKEGLYKLLSDTIFARAHAKSNNHPVYYYRMSIETELNGFKRMCQIKTKGVSHGDDMFYLLKTLMTPKITPGSIEDTSLRRFVKLWTNFARTGNPTPVVDPLLGTKWLPVKENELNFLDIGEDLVPGRNPDIVRMEFWDEISRGIKIRY